MSNDPIRLSDFRETWAETDIQDALAHHLRQAQNGKYRAIAIAAIDNDGGANISFVTLYRPTEHPVGMAILGAVELVKGKIVKWLNDG